MLEKAGKLFGVLTALAVLLGASDGAIARPGQLDPSFGQRGIVTTPVDLGPDWRQATIEVSPAADGSFVVASRNRLIRYLPDGKLDESFADAGQLRIDEVEGLEFEIADVATDSHGRIVVFGASGTGIDESFVHSSTATILRLDSDGHFDPGFGGGDGVVRGDLGLEVPGYSEIETGVSLGIVDADDRPVLVENVTWVFLCCTTKAQAGLMDRAVVRLTSTGELDPSFAADNAWMPEGDEAVTALTLAEGGNPQILARPGLGISPRPGGLILKRLTADGSDDSAFGPKGQRMYAGGTPRGMTVDPFGGTLLVGERPLPYGSGARLTRLAVLRLTPDGSPDPGFGRVEPAWSACPGAVPSARLSPTRRDGPCSPEPPLASPRHPTATRATGSGPPGSTPPATSTAALVAMAMSEPPPAWWPEVPSSTAKAG